MTDDHDHDHGADQNAHDHGHDAHDHGHDAHDHAHDAHDHAHDGDAHEHIHEASYADEVTAFRADKDEFFRTAHQSPIPHEQRHEYPGLRYYPPDEAYRIEGLHLEPDPDPTATTEIVTSDGKTREAFRVGTLTFSVPGGSASLAGYAFEPGPVEELFIPFRDATSGSDTYGAGRYLDLEPEDDGSYALDFNLAYNPWCAYAPQYSCPLPPRENWLTFAIPAGEQVPIETH
jgi:uncharacterized protein (DUF1684 family)